jgi:hypothetical protein
VTTPRRSSACVRCASSGFGGCGRNRNARRTENDP